MKIFGRTLLEYILPIKYYILASILIVISQYTIALPISNIYPQYSFVINLTQILWEIMVALSVITLIKKYDDFGIKNLFVVWIIYSLAIHGLKVSIRYFFYSRDVAYVIDRFSYGSLLVFAVSVGLGTILLYIKKKKLFKF